MDYQYFEKCIKEKVTLDQKEFSIFSKLPLHQKEQLLKIACVYEQLNTAQGFYRHISGREKLMGDILGEIICKHPQKSKETVQWLLSFKDMPTNIENDFRQIMNKQNPAIWELIFSNIPFSEKKIFYLIGHCIKEQLVDGLNWIIDKQQHHYLPYQHDMYYWGIFLSWQNKRENMGQLIMDKLVTFFPDDLYEIKNKLAKAEYSVPHFTKVVIKNTVIFREFFTNKENTALKFKLEQFLKDDVGQKKKLKI